MPTVLYINDNQLLLEHDGTVTHSQGYAWLTNKKLHFDLDPQNRAVNHSRLDPAQINSSYWQNCNESSIVQNDQGLQNAADLIWAHLSQLIDGKGINEIYFVVPPHYHEQNLELLLGIASACNLKVLGMVNKAALEISQVAEGGGLYTHWDIQLHQCVKSQVRVDQGQCTLDNVELVRGLSIQSVQDNLLRYLQTLFIQNDRFDPLHLAETEQQLFDQLFDVSSQLLDKGKANISVQHGSNLHSVNIDSQQWREALQAALSVLSDQNDKTLLSYNGSHPLFLIDQVSPDEQLQVHSKLSEKTLTHIVANSDGENNASDYWVTLPTVSSTPRDKQIEQTLEKSHVAPEEPNTKREQSFRAETEDQSVTHLLHNGIAVPLEDAYIEFRDNQMALGTSNGSPVFTLLEQNKAYIVSDSSRQTLRVNDRIASNLADGVVLAVCVKN